MQYSSRSVELLVHKIRDISLQRLRTYTKCEKFEILQCSRSGSIPGYWMVIVLGAAAELKITLKVFFMTSAGSSLGHSIFQSKSPSSEMTCDLMKEYVNLWIGGIKIFLEQNEYQFGVSLPLVTRGFDHLFLVQPAGERVFYDEWTISNQIAVVQCQSTVELTSEILLKFEQEPIDDVTIW